MQILVQVGPSHFVIKILWLGTKIKSTFHKFFFFLEFLNELFDIGLPDKHCFWHACPPKQDGIEIVITRTSE